jgi:hypothetical protein
MTDTIFTDKELKLSLRNSGALQDSPPLQMRTITYNIMRLHSGAGVITSWEPDCSPQGMTVIKTSLEPSN